MNNVGNVLACVVLTGDLLEQLVGGDVERLNLDAGVLLSEGLGYLGDTGRDRVNRYLALFLCLLVQLFVGLVGVEDAGGLLPVGQLQGACCCRCVRVLRALSCIAVAAVRRTAAKIPASVRLCFNIVFSSSLFLLYSFGGGSEFSAPFLSDKRFFSAYTEYLMSFVDFLSNTLILFRSMDR